MQLDEDLLHDVLDVAAGADEARNEPADRLAVRSDEAIERAEIAVLRAQDEIVDGGRLTVHGGARSS